MKLDKKKFPMLSAVLASEEAEAAKGKPTSYMVAIKRRIVIEPVLYAETIATSPEAAVKDVRENLWGYLGKDDIPVDDQFMNEAKHDLELKEFEAGDLKFISAGKASQYHSPEECTLCESVQPKIK